MKTPSTILVAVDESDNAKRAVETAIWLARSVNARLVAVHVSPLAPVAESLSPSAIDKMQKAYANEGSKILADIALEASTKYGIKMDVLLETGDAREKILDAARQNHAGIIVIGSRGAGKLSRFLLGSVSQSIAQHSKIPVLIVK